MKPTTDFQSVCDAAERIHGYAHKTAVIESRSLNRYFGARIRFKCEHMQVINAFKFRGAFNALSQLSEDQRERGVITYSSGNHAQAIAKAAAILNIDATIVMPSNVPSIKLAGVKAQGARMEFYDPDTEFREEVAERINADNSMTLIPPFNHPDVIAGQGTAALELLNDYPETNQILVPCGGGGLLAGTLLASSGVNPSCEVYGVEPDNADDAKQSLEQGKIISIDYPDTIADGVRTLELGSITFEIIKHNVSGIVSVSEDAIKTALSTLSFHFKQWLEPSAVLGFAALLENKITVGSHVGIILSGGNADIHSIETILSNYEPIKL